jgi:hypothetical protein
LVDDFYKLIFLLDRSIVDNLLFLGLLSDGDEATKPEGSIVRIGKELFCLGEYEGKISLFY